MSMAERLRSTLITIGENVPDDLNECGTEEIAEIIEHVENSSHRDACSALSLAKLVMAEKRKEG